MTSSTSFNNRHVETSPFSINQYVAHDEKQSGCEDFDNDATIRGSKAHHSNNVQNPKPSSRHLPRSQSDSGSLFSRLHDNANTDLILERTASVTYSSQLPRPSPKKRITMLEYDLLESVVINSNEASHVFPIRSSSIAASTTVRPPSRLPRPTSATTPFPEPVTPSPMPRIKMHARHHMRMSMTTNDLASLQEEITPREDIKDPRRSSASAMASPSKLPRLVARNEATPSTVAKGLMGEKRFVSTPASLPSHKKENIVPIGLLRQVSPAQARSQAHALVQPHQHLAALKSQAQHLQPQISSTAQPTIALDPSHAVITQRGIPKSRTVGMLSNLRTTFRRSRSSLHVSHGSRKSSISSSITTSTLEHEIAEDDTLTQPTSETLAFGYKPIGYWAGRFSSVHDRFHNELLAASLSDEDEFQAYIDTSGDFPDMAKKSEQHKTINKLKSSATEANLYREDTPVEQLERRKFTAADEDARCLRVLKHLSTCCGDEAARKSLHAFQLQLARSRGKPELLPEGGKIEPLLERLGRKVEGAFGRRLSTITK